MFWLIIIIIALYFIISYPALSFFLIAITVFIIIYNALSKKKTKRRELSSSSNSHVSIQETKNTSKYGSNRETITNDVYNEKPSFIPVEISYELKPVTKEYPLLDVTKEPVLKYCEYDVKGKNPVTKRMKTNHVVAERNATDNAITQKSGLLEPYTITPYFVEPSQKQIDYAKDLNILHPKNCTLHDMSALISRQLGDIVNPFINDNLIEYAAINNIYVSPYTSDVCGAWEIIHSLPPKECIVFFAYLIYCAQTKQKIENLYNTPNCHIFYGFTDTLSDINETGKYIKDHYSDKTAYTGTVDRRNKRMANLRDDIWQYLDNNIPQ